MLLIFSFLLNFTYIFSDDNSGGENNIVNTISLSLIDENVPGYATFAGFQNHVIENQYGIFVAYIRRATTWDQEGNPLTYWWRLARSVDGGLTFTTVYEEGYKNTRAPVLEDDGYGNIILIRPDFSTGQIYFYKFNASNNFHVPVLFKQISGIPAQGKFVAYFDLYRRQIYYLTNNENGNKEARFAVLSENGDVLKNYSLSNYYGLANYSLTSAGCLAYLEYPQIQMDGPTIYVSWTTQKYDDPEQTEQTEQTTTTRLYSSIHFIKSLDGGITWEKIDGTKLSLPITPDVYGPADNLLGYNMTNWHRWLTHFLPYLGYIHFAEQDGEGSQLNYIRFNINSNIKDVNTNVNYYTQSTNHWSGSSVILDTGGFFIPSNYETNTLYYVGMDWQTTDPDTSQHQGPVGILRSKDNGQTWQDYARSVNEGPGGVNILRPYSFIGPRHVTSDASIIGFFTDATDANNLKVYFFKVGVALGN